MEKCWICNDNPPAEGQTSCPSCQATYVQARRWTAKNPEERADEVARLKKTLRIIGLVRAGVAPKEVARKVASRRA